MASLLLLFFTRASGHGMLVTPTSRNAADRFLPAFSKGKAPRVPSCICGDQKYGCDAGLRNQAGGQSCLWFSQGCTIGCPACTGVGSHSGGPRADSEGLCDSTQQPTLPKYAWTMNRKAVESSQQDSYRRNPWRAPGHAPVEDACGRAGGTDPRNMGPGAAVFTETAVAKGGDLGSKVLGPSKWQTVWRAGFAVEVSWGIRYNHGGGYQYRLCPAEEELTEDCFMRMPLEFVRTGQQLLWNNGTRLPIKGTFVDRGTRPAGSTWAMNPIPRINFDSKSSGQPADEGGCVFAEGEVRGSACRQFEPPCAWDDGWFPQPGLRNVTDVEGACSGDWTAGVIVDRVLVPADLAPGDYVLGWRWDSEESDQVWSSCADVRIVARPHFV